MCEKMYNDLCEVCSVADCKVPDDCKTLDDITRKVVECQKFEAKPTFKIKCTYEYGDQIAVVTKETHKFPDYLPWKTKKQSNRTKRFQKPTVDEINNYCFEKGYVIDAQEFIDYFNSVGWKVGKTLKPMTSWKGAVANWYRKNKSKPEKDIEITYENIDLLREKYPDFDWDEYEEEDFKPRFYEGKLGKGVVLLSRVQEDMFLETVDDYRLFNHYIELLADFIIKTKPNIRSHFNLLMKWYRENFRGFNYGG